jgi:dTDP-4-dehydrorhamnose reductase
MLHRRFSLVLDRSAMKALLTGSGGLLGGAFLQELAGCEVTTVGRERLDVSRPSEVMSLLDASRPDVVINCAAHTDVEGAERDPNSAFAINGLLPGLLAAACRSSGATLVHISSTGCYGEGKSEPYTEEDLVQPTTTHHRSKVAGEQAVQEAGCRHLILRTGWLFGGRPSHSKNFVWKRLAEARQTERITTDASQRGNPTYAPDVARRALELLDIGLRGKFNVVATGTASRYEYVARIVAAAGLPCDVRPGPAFERLAKVSMNEAARNYRMELLGLEPMPLWTDSLTRYVGELMSAPEWRAGLP